MRVERLQSNDSCRGGIEYPVNMNYRFQIIFVEREPFMQIWCFLDFNSLLRYFPSRWLFSLFSLQCTWLTLLTEFSYLYFGHILYRIPLHLCRIVWGAEQRDLLTTKTMALNKCPVNFKSIRPTAGQSVRLVRWSISRSSGQLVRQLVTSGYSISQSVSQSVSQSASRPVGHWPSGPAVQ